MYPKLSKEEAKSPIDFTICNAITCYTSKEYKQYDVGRYKYLHCFWHVLVANFARQML